MVRDFIFHFVALFFICCNYQKQFLSLKLIQISVKCEEANSIKIQLLRYCISLLIVLPSGNYSRRCGKWQIEIFSSKIISYLKYHYLKKFIHISVVRMILLHILERFWVLYVIISTALKYFNHSLLLWCIGKIFLYLSFDKLVIPLDTNHL